MKGIQSLADLQFVISSRPDFAFNCVLLATREDSQYNHFIEFWREIDASTGSNCRVFVFLDHPLLPPANANAYALVISLDRPTGSLAAYEIGRGLSVPRTSMPCLAVFEGGPKGVQPVVVVPLPSSGKLTPFLRTLFDMMDHVARESPTGRLERLQRRLAAKRVLRVARAPLADLIEKNLGSRTADLIDPRDG